jgi:uncharacterized membrane protein
MVDTVLMIGAFLAAFYALTFARWLKQGGNKQGAYVVFVVAMSAVALPIYRMITRD